MLGIEQIVGHTGIFWNLAKM